MICGFYLVYEPASKDRGSGSQGTVSTQSTQSTPHPRARISPAGKSPCEVARELRDQALHAHRICKHISGHLPEHVAAIVHADCAIRLLIRLGGGQCGVSHLRACSGSNKPKAQTDRSTLCITVVFCAVPLKMSPKIDVFS